MTRICLLIFTLLGGLASHPATAAESVVSIPMVTFTLPDGYTDKHSRGIDSVAGYITIRDKPFKIHYDSITWEGLGGAKTFSKIPSFILDHTSYYERLENSPAPAGIVVWVNPAHPETPLVYVWVFGVGLVFNVDVSGKVTVQDAVSVLRAIKIQKVDSP